MVDQTEHGSNDPFCCPKVDMKRRFVITNGRLTPLNGVETNIDTTWIDPVSKGLSPECRC